MTTYMRLVRDDEMDFQEQDTEDVGQTGEPVAEEPQVVEKQGEVEQKDGPVEDAGEAGDASQPLPDVDLSVLEALLFSTHHPLTPQRLVELLQLKSVKTLRQAIKALNQQYAEQKRAFRIEQVANGYQMLTLPEFGEHLNTLHRREADAKLTKAALETLAIIAYKQPILRADIEAIRGVACGETVRSLMEKHLVKIAGRAELPGRPILYGTTKRFLEVFGLNSLKDLPQADPLQKPPAAAAE